MFLCFVDIYAFRLVILDAYEFADLHVSELGIVDVVTKFNTKNTIAFIKLSEDEQS